MSADEAVWLPLKRWSDFSGRSRRLEFWAWTLLTMMIAMVLGGIAAGFELFALVAGPLWLVAMLVRAVDIAIALALLVPSTSVGVRRLHDTGRTGLWLLLPLLPLFAALYFAAATANWFAAVLLAFVAAPLFGLVVIVLLLIPGTPGPNRYGDDPKAAR